MERPFIFIECKTTWRKEFEVTSGRQPTYALFFLKKGSFKLTLDGSEHIVRERDCVIFSDDIDFFRTVIEPVSFVYLKFKINPRCPFQVDIPLGMIHFKNCKRFIDSIEKYDALTEAQTPAAIYYREHLLEDILLQAFAEYKGRSLTDMHTGNIEYKLEGCRDKIAKAAVQYIISHISEKLTVDSLCHVCGTNPSTLNFKLRKEFSTSTAALIEKLRMSEARKLLRNTTFKINEIASRCGFENIYYFSSVFKKNHNISPTEYRSRYR